MIQEMLLEVCLMMKIDQKIIEKLIKVLARLSYKKVHCQPKCKAVFLLAQFELDEMSYGDCQAEE